MTTTVDIDLNAIQVFMKDPNGPVNRYMAVIAEAVKQATLSQIHGYALEFLGPTIVKRLVMMDDGPHYLVGSANTKTQEHWITGNPLLAFAWPNNPFPSDKQPKGGIFYFRKVHNMGSDFAPYLTERLLTALTVVKGV